MVKIYGKGYCMSTMEKITFNLPSELKEQVHALKDELHMSMSNIYVEAIKKFVKEQEELKWKQGANLASKDENYLKLIDELDQEQDDIYGY